MLRVNNKVYLYLIFILFAITTDAFGMMKARSHPPEVEPSVGQRVSGSYQPPVEPAVELHIEQSPRPLITLPTLYDPKRKMYYFVKVTEIGEDGDGTHFSSEDLSSQFKIRALEKAGMQLEGLLEEQRTLAASSSSADHTKAYRENIAKIEESLRQASSELSKQTSVL